MTAGRPCSVMKQGRNPAQYLVEALPERHPLARGETVDVRALAAGPIIAPTQHENPGLFPRIRVLFDELAIQPTWSSARSTSDRYDITAPLYAARPGQARSHGRIRGKSQPALWIPSRRGGCGPVSAGPGAWAGSGSGRLGRSGSGGP